MPCMPCWARALPESPTIGNRRRLFPCETRVLSAFAMFSLKDPSLLAFDDRRSDANMKGAVRQPLDTQAIPASMEKVVP